MPTRVDIAGLRTPTLVVWVVHHPWAALPAPLGNLRGILGGLKADGWRKFMALMVFLWMVLSLSVFRRSINTWSTDNHIVLYLYSIFKCYATQKYSKQSCFGKCLVSWRINQWCFNQKKTRGRYFFGQENIHVSCPHGPGDVPQKIWNLKGILCFFVIFIMDDDHILYNRIPCVYQKNTPKQRHKKSDAKKIINPKTQKSVEDVTQTIPWNHDINNAEKKQIYIRKKHTEIIQKILTVVGKRFFQNSNLLSNQLQLSHHIAP